MAIIQLIQFTCGLLFSIYMMISGLLGFLDGLDINAVQGQLVIGLATAALTIFTARFVLVTQPPAVTAILYPLAYAAVCLGLNQVLGAPFESWIQMTEMIDR